ncbi:hypothetical protein AURDEDRAFT_162796 [Auricularia subglabra TFB-10046 SS5]|nr:hypothetical protein AURDEDRAFT_162796 [Auricularia subglabra TFB-10046 SS5]
MTGSHPIATESAKWIQVQDNCFEGSWNKGAGGNGYVRGSRVWDSLDYNNTLRNLRHFTFQWCVMGNIAIVNNMTNDFNLHGGWEGFNLVKLNLITVPYSHRPGSCRFNCGGEGPQNVFYRYAYEGYEFAPNTGQVDYLPYFNRDGSLSDTIWQFGWDRGIGGWGLGMDPSGLLAITTNNGARTKFGTTTPSLVASLAADGIDLEWSPCAS